MTDLQIFQAERVVNVEDVRIVPLLGKPVLKIRHQACNSIASLRVNDTRIDFVRDGLTTIYADIPSTAAGGISSVVLIAGEGAPVGEVVAIKNRFLPGGLVTGKERLAQSFLITLLTEQGSVSRNPSFGTNLTALLRTGMRDRISLRIAVTKAIESAQLQLIRAQMQQRGIPPEEQLVSATLESIVDTERGVRADVRLRTAAGIDALVSTGL
jgi:phage baseplate assembly protein W